jgi:hypothetical protein
LGLKRLERADRAVQISGVAPGNDATARGYLYVAGHRTGRLQALKLSVQTTPTTRTITIPASVLSATHAYARRGAHHYRYATLKFIVTVTDRSTGLRYPYDYSTYSRLRV